MYLKEDYGAIFTQITICSWGFLWKDDYLNVVEFYPLFLIFGLKYLILLFSFYIRIFWFHLKGKYDGTIKIANLLQIVMS